MRGYLGGVMVVLVATLTLWMATQARPIGQEARKPLTDRSSAPHWK